MLSAQDLRGLYAIPPTPAKPGADRWDATDTVDLDETVRLTEQLIRDGVSGFMVLGTTGECATLTREDYEAYVDALLSFFATDQVFVCLIQRESLGDGSRVSEFFGRFVDDAVAALGPTAAEAGVSPQWLVLDLVALCWYPFAHEHTLVPALGLDPRDPSFAVEQRRHLGELMRALAALRSSSAGRMRTP